MLIFSSPESRFSDPDDKENELKQCPILKWAESQQVQAYDLKDLLRSQVALSNPSWPTIPGAEVSHLSIKDSLLDALVEGLKAKIENSPPNEK